MKVTALITLFAVVLLQGGKKNPSPQGHTLDAEGTCQTAINMYSQPRGGSVSALSDQELSSLPDKLMECISSSFHNQPLGTVISVLHANTNREKQRRIDHQQLADLRRKYDSLVAASRSSRNLSRGQLGDVVSGSGSRCEEGHWIDSVSDDGGIIKLEDGSVWEVDEVDRIDSSLWLPVDNVLLCGSKMINTDESNESVSISRLK